MTVLFVFKRNKKFFCKCAKVRKEIHTLTETQNLFTVCVIAVCSVFDLFQCWLSTVGSQAFPVAGPQTWNDLPEDLTSAESLTTFRHLLKIHLFRKSFPDCMLDINWLSPVDLAIVPLLRPPKHIVTDWLMFKSPDVNGSQASVFRHFCHCWSKLLVQELAVQVWVALERLSSMYRQHTV